MPMKTWALLGVAATCSFACAGVPAPVPLQPEKVSTLHLGQFAAVSLPSTANYSVGSAGTALILIKQELQEDKTISVYRAAEIGNDTLVATPKDPGPDGCVSCVTVHYFVTVIQ